ncbi:response regulator, partial [Gordonibacter pamelaeae]
APADPAPAPVPAADSPLAGLRMLLAEDNDVNARITTSLLKLRGIDVVRARIGEEALELYEDSEPGGFDAVLMDIKMPGMDGWEAARRIRASARPDAQRIALVALSANAFAEDARRSRAVGMDGHIGKPVDFDELEALFGRIRSGRCKGKDNA